MSKCSICRIEQTKENSNIDNRRSCGFASRCKECNKIYMDEYIFNKTGYNKIVGYFVECNNCGKIIKKPLCRILRHENITCSKKCGYEIREVIPWNKGKQFSTPAKERNYKRHREYLEYKNWHEECLKRDWYKCQLCSSKEKIEVHHIKSYKDYPNDRVDINNGVTICKPCHLWVHNIDVQAQQ